MNGIAVGLKVLVSALIAGTITGCTAYLAADPHNIRWPVIIVGGVLVMLKDVNAYLSKSPVSGN